MPHRQSFQIPTHSQRQSRLSTTHDRSVVSARSQGGAENTGSETGSIASRYSPAPVRSMPPPATADGVCGSPRESRGRVARTLERRSPDVIIGPVAGAKEAPSVRGADMDVKVGTRVEALTARTGVVYRRTNDWLDGHSWVFLFACVVPFMTGWPLYWPPYQALAGVWAVVTVIRYVRLRRRGDATAADHWRLLLLLLSGLWPLWELMYRLRRGKARVAALRTPASARVTLWPPDAPTSS
jgi:hypothetical protein